MFSSPSTKNRSLTSPTKLKGYKSFLLEENCLMPFKFPDPTAEHLQSTRAHFKENILPQLLQNISRELSAVQSKKSDLRTRYLPKVSHLLSAAEPSPTADAVLRKPPLDGTVQGTFMASQQSSANVSIDSSDGPRVEAENIFAGTMRNKPVSQLTRGEVVRLLWQTDILLTYMEDTFFESKTDFQTETNLAGVKQWASDPLIRLAKTLSFGRVDPISEVAVCQTRACILRDVERIGEILELCRNVTGANTRASQSAIAKMETSAQNYLELISPIFSETTVSGKASTLISRLESACQPLTEFREALDGLRGELQTINDNCVTHFAKEKQATARAVETTAHAMREIEVGDDAISGWLQERLQSASNLSPVAEYEPLSDEGLSTEDDIPAQNRIRTTNGIPSKNSISEIAHTHGINSELDTTISEIKENRISGSVSRSGKIAATS